MILCLREKKRKYQIMRKDSGMSREEGKETMSQEVSQTATCELKVELPLDAVAQLAQRAAAAGVTLEQLVAQEVHKLVK